MSTSSVGVSSSSVGDSSDLSSSDDDNYLNGYGKGKKKKNMDQTMIIHSSEGDEIFNDQTLTLTLPEQDELLTVSPPLPIDILGDDLDNYNPNDNDIVTPFVDKDTDSDFDDDSDSDDALNYLNIASPKAKKGYRQSDANLTPLPYDDAKKAKDKQIRNKHQKRYSKYDNDDFDDLDDYKQKIKQNKPLKSLKPLKQDTSTTPIKPIQISAITPVTRKSNKKSKKKISKSTKNSAKNNKKNGTIGKKKVNKKGNTTGKNNKNNIKTNKNIKKGNINGKNSKKNGKNNNKKGKKNKNTNSKQKNNKNNTKNTKNNNKNGKNGKNNKKKNKKKKKKSSLVINTSSTAETDAASDSDDNNNKQSYGTGYDNKINITNIKYGTTLQTPTTPFKKAGGTGLGSVSGHKSPSDYFNRKTKDRYSGFEMNTYSSSDDDDKINKYNRNNGRNDPATLMKNYKSTPLLNPDDLGSDNSDDLVNQYLSKKDPSISPPVPKQIAKNLIGPSKPSTNPFGAGNKNRNNPRRKKHTLKAFLSVDLTDFVNGPDDDNFDISKSVCKYYDKITGDTDTVTIVSDKGKGPNTAYWSKGDYNRVLKNVNGKYIMVYRACKHVPCQIKVNQDIFESCVKGLCMDNLNHSQLIADKLDCVFGEGCHVSMASHDDFEVFCRYSDGYITEVELPSGDFVVAWRR